MSNPLAPVWDAYQAARDALRVTRRVVKREEDGTVSGVITDRHCFFSMTYDDAEARLDAARIELDNLTVVAMVAVFERALRDSIRGHINQRLPAGNAFESATRDRVLEDAEYWAIGPCLVDLIFIHAIPEDRRGDVKQIIDHRNDIAHGHVRGIAPPGYATPDVVFRRLTDYLSMVGLAAP